jgi:hypothetical protein
MRATDPIAVYVRELGSRLGGSWLHRRRIIAEVRDHLSEAVASDPLVEQDPAAAARRAIARFGTVEETARAFAAGPERGFGRARLAIAVAAAALVSVAITTPLLIRSSGPGPSQRTNLNASPHNRLQAVKLCPIPATAPVAAAAAARYFGLTHAQLRTLLQAGKSLAQLAGERHKSVDGLTSTVEDAVKADLRARLDAAAKRIPHLAQAEVSRFLSNSSSRIANVVNQMVSRPRLGVPRQCPRLSVDRLRPSRAT